MDKEKGIWKKAEKFEESATVEKWKLMFEGKKVANYFMENVNVEKLRGDWFLGHILYTSYKYYKYLIERMAFGFVDRLTMARHACIEFYHPLTRCVINGIIGKKASIWECPWPTFHDIGT